ncbi:MAG: S41 family peptidase [Planctomycetota bacterium]|nr:S41 family peptidase [Planctomycetota bacterium]
MPTPFLTALRFFIGHSPRSSTCFAAVVMVGVLVGGVRWETNTAAETPGPSEPPPADADEYFELLTLFTNALDEIDRNYVQPVSRRELMEAAIEGMLKKLDRHSSYIPPQGLDDLKTDVESEFGGLGIRISADKGSLIVISPLYASPAYRVGIEAGDAILSIDGMSTDGMSIDQAVHKLKGPVGSEVVLVVRHELQGKIETLRVSREVVRVQSVLGYRRQPNHAWDYVLDANQKIGYLRITSFGRHTGQELRDALVQMQQQGMESLILDLRFNPGGLLSAAVEVSDLFLATGRIVSTSGRNVVARSWDAVAEGTFDRFRMAVLVNRYSASASEIVSAALQDHGRAAIVGERTWGKASVQNIIELEGGRSALKLTTAGYQRPSGRNIQRYPGSPEEDWGVQPDPQLVVQATSEEMDLLQKHQSELDLLRRVTPPEEPQFVPVKDVQVNQTTEVPFVDRQLQKAIEFLQTQYAKR